MRELKIEKTKDSSSRERYLQELEKASKMGGKGFVFLMYEHLKRVFKTGNSKYVSDKQNLMYPGIVEAIENHRKIRKFEFHRFFEAGHVASSQAACFNLFLPIMISDHAAEVLACVKPDMKKIDDSRLDHGFCFEYWREEPLYAESSYKGLLNDHSKIYGTDADFAVSYIDKDEKKCLWLIEHKLTETEFTRCNVYHNSKHSEERAVCDGLTFAELINEPNKCYYTWKRHFAYWSHTTQELFPFVDANKKGCPFKDGMCQLWRNVLLAEEARKTYGYDKMFFSVAKPEGNTLLNDSIDRFSEIVKPGVFSVINPRELFRAANAFDDDLLHDWRKWYAKVYLI